MIFVFLLMAGLGIMEVRERQREIAIMRAVGKPSLSITGMFLYKYLILSVPGGVIGFFAGTLLSFAYKTDSIVSKMAVNWESLGFCIAASLIISMIAGLIPLVYALKLEPSRIIGEG
jgi:putative ABC transport system permease protein